MDDANPGSTTDGDDREWRFTLEEVGADDSDLVEPEPVDPVNAVFFLLGVGATLALVITFLF